jgi:hypothetical protein
MAAVDPEHDADPPTGTGRGPGGATSRPGPWRRDVVVAVLVAVVAVGAVVAWWLDRRDPPAVNGAPAVAAFLEASERNLDASYRLDGEITRTMPDGRTLTSGLLIVQRPPDRLQRSLGSTVGVLAGRTVNCGAGDDCAVSGAAEPFDVRRADQMRALDEYVGGDDPVYAVSATGNACYELRRRRTEPAAVYGSRAELCFDQSTGALRRLEVQRDGGATDVLEGSVVSGRVDDADFDLSADDTYDPEGA